MKRTPHAAERLECLDRRSSTSKARLQPPCFFERCNMSEQTQIVVEGFNADVCEPAELRHRVLNGAPKDFVFEVTKLVDSKAKVVVSDDKWAIGKIGEIDCQCAASRLPEPKLTIESESASKRFDDSRGPGTHPACEPFSAAPSPRASRRAVPRLPVTKWAKEHRGSEPV